MDRKAFVEAVKELARVVLIAIIPIIVESLTNGGMNYRLVAVTGAIALLRAIEKYLYESGSKNIVTDTLRFE